MKTIKAIETVYAGCRFRSRLEARWAVFFDTLGVEWQYEPQGFVVGLAERRYLPDFYLPDYYLSGDNVWVEVKGHPDQLDFGLMLDAVDYGDGLPDVATGAGGLLILGDIPRPSGGEPVFPFLSHHKGVTSGRWTFSQGPIQDNGWGYSATGTAENVPDEIRDALLGRERAPWRHSGIDRALTAARSSRFEHGENGHRTRR